jgi:hypothetical protein
MVGLKGCRSPRYAGQGNIDYGQRAALFGMVPKGPEAPGHIIHAFSQVAQMTRIPYVAIGLLARLSLCPSMSARGEEVPDGPKALFNDAFIPTVHFSILSAGQPRMRAGLCAWRVKPIPANVNSSPLMKFDADRRSEVTTPHRPIIFRLKG